MRQIRVTCMGYYHPHGRQLDLIDTLVAPAARISNVRYPLVDWPGHMFRQSMAIARRLSHIIRSPDDPMQPNCCWTAVGRKCGVDFRANLCRER